MTYTSNFEKLLQCAAETYINEEIERYKNADISDISISNKLSSKVYKRIQAATTDKTLLHFFIKAACIILAVGITAFTISMSIPTVRSLFFQFIEEKFGRYIGVAYYDLDSDSATVIDTIETPDIPSNWRTNIIADTPTMFSCELIGNEDESILFTQQLKNTEETFLYIDNDPISTETVYLNDIPATLYTYADGAQILLWTDRYVFTMTAHNTSRETLLALAKTVTAK